MIAAVLAGQLPHQLVPLTEWLTVPELGLVVDCAVTFGNIVSIMA